MTDKTQALEALETIQRTLERVIRDIKSPVLAPGPVKEILETTVMRMDAVKLKIAALSEPAQTDGLEEALEALQAELDYEATLPDPVAKTYRLGVIMQNYELTVRQIISTLQAARSQAAPQVTEEAVIAGNRNYPMRFITVMKDGSYIGVQNASDAQYDAAIFSDDFLCTIDVRAATETMLLNNKVRDTALKQQEE